MQKKQEKRQFYCLDKGKFKFFLEFSAQKL